eukprot:2061463-Amphidinium_carterae.1
MSTTLLLLQWRHSTSATTGKRERRVDPRKLSRALRRQHIRIVVAGLTRDDVRFRWLIAHSYKVNGANVMHEFTNDDLQRNFEGTISMPGAHMQQAMEDTNNFTRMSNGSEFTHHDFINGAIRINEYFDRVPRHNS